MNTLATRLLNKETLPQLVSEGAALVDNEVRRQKGIGGLAIKAGYKAFKTIMPNIVEKAVAFLMSEFVTVIERHHADYQAARPAGMDFKGWLVQHADPVAEDLLQVTDRVIQNTGRTTLKKIYNSLRGRARSYVQEAVPAMADLIARHEP